MDSSTFADIAAGAGAHAQEAQLDAIVAWLMAQEQRINELDKTLSLIHI